MSGHNKWSKIKHIKAKTDAVKGKAFSKAALEIVAAVKEGGSDDPGMNARLRLAIDLAKKVNMPSDNIKRAIERAIGKGDGAAIESCIYEGYAPGGIALMIETLTNNRNRTAGDVRSTLEKNHGSLGTPGSVSYLFTKKGLFTFNKNDITEDQLMEALLDAGIEDISDTQDGYLEVVCAYDQYDHCVKAIEEKKLKMESGEVSMIPETTILITDRDKAESIINLIDKIESLDDVQKVNSNMEISDTLLTELANQ